MVTPPTQLASTNSHGNGDLLKMDLPGRPQVAVLSEGMYQLDIFFYCPQQQPLTPLPLQLARQSESIISYPKRLSKNTPDRRRQSSPHLS